MRIPSYFTHEVRVMNDIATKQEVFDMCEKVFGRKCFYLEPIWWKTHDLKIEKGNNLYYKSDVTSVIPACIFYFCVFYLEKFLEWQSLDR